MSGGVFRWSHVFLHPQASLKKFMDYIQTSAVDKMVKFMDKGLDPNFQDSDTGGKEGGGFSTPGDSSFIASSPSGGLYPHRLRVFGGSRRLVYGLNALLCVTSVALGSKCEKHSSHTVTGGVRCVSVH